MIIYAIHGKMHSGKSTLASTLEYEVLKKNGAVRRLHFKTPILNAARQLGFTDLDLREKSPAMRALLQALGPALLEREPRLILDEMHRTLNEKPALVVVIDDVRRKQEFDYLKSHAPGKTVLIKLERLGYEPPASQNPSHSTETDLDAIPDRKWAHVLKLPTMGDSIDEWAPIAQAILRGETWTSS